MIAQTRVGKRSVLFPATGALLLRSSDLPWAIFPHTCLCPLAFVLWRYCRVQVLLCFFSSPRAPWREATISHVGVLLTMVLLVTLGIVIFLVAVTTEKTENTSHKPAAPLFNYSSVSLPPDHIPYFLYNNKKLAKQCRLDPLCPFKVRYRLCHCNSQSSSICYVHVGYSWVLLSRWTC